jgi:restriction endonuclease Mrr
MSSYSSWAFQILIHWKSSTIQGTKTKSSNRYQKTPPFDIIIKLLHWMGYKRATAGTHCRSTSQQTITMMWKKPNTLDPQLNHIYQKMKRRTQIAGLEWIVKSP